MNKKNKKMYSILFYQIRGWFAYIHKYGDKTTFFGEEKDSTILLSIFFTLNISTLWRYFDLPLIFENRSINFVLLYIVVLMINWFFLIIKGYSKKIILKYSKKDFFILLFHGILVISYAVLTIYFFNHYKFPVKVPS
jgi:hypothetical protein